MKIAIPYLIALATSLSMNCFSQGIELSGIVRKQDGCVIANAEVEVYLAGERVLREVESDDDGHFRIRNFHSGEYEFRISHSAFSKKIVQIVEFRKQELLKRMDFVFTDSGRITYPSIWIPCEDTLNSARLALLKFHSGGTLGFDPPFYTPSTPGNQTTILAEDLERMPR